MSASYPPPRWGQPAHPAAHLPNPGTGAPAVVWDPLTPVGYGQHVEQVEEAYSHLYGRPRGRGVSVAAMVLGIIAIVMCAAPVLSYGAVLLGAIATVLAIIGLRRPMARGMAITGLVLGPIALVAAIFTSIYWTGVFADAIDTYNQCEEQHPGRGPAFQRCVEQGGDEGRVAPPADGEPA